MNNTVSIRTTYWTLLLLLLATGLGCKPLYINNFSDRINPSNDRSWSPEFTLLPSATIEQGTIHLKNIRNINYVTEHDFVVKHFDRSIRIDDIQSVDFIVTPFQNAPALAHTMLSFGLTDGSYIAVSVEIRNEAGEEYSPLLGISNQFEITYVIADEKDLIRLRTRHREADVYVYPSVASPQQSQELFVDVLRRVNDLNTQPEFYNTLKNNCTTNLVDHVNRLNPDRIAFGWRVLLPGFSAEYAYDLGLLDNRIPFEDLKSIAYVNDLAESSYNHPEFSQKIRERKRHIERLASRKKLDNRMPSGGQFLDQTIHRPRKRWR